MVRPCFECHFGMGMSIERQRSIIENFIPHTFRTILSMNALKGNVNLPIFAWHVKELVPFATVNRAVYHVLVTDLFKTT